MISYIMPISQLTKLSLLNIDRIFLTRCVIDNSIKTKLDIPELDIDQFIKHIVSDDYFQLNLRNIYKYFEKKI